MRRGASLFLCVILLVEVLGLFLPLSAVKVRATSTGGDSFTIFGGSWQAIMAKENNYANGTGVVPLLSGYKKRVFTGVGFLRAYVADRVVQGPLVEPAHEQSFALHLEPDVESHRWEDRVTVLEWTVTSASVRSWVSVDGDKSETTVTGGETVAPGSTPFTLDWRQPDAGYTWRKYHDSLAVVEAGSGNHTLVYGMGLESEASSYVRFRCEDGGSDGVCQVMVDIDVQELYGWEWEGGSTPPPQPPGKYRLEIRVEGSGATVPSPGVYYFEEGSAVTVKATPSSGWYFDHWELDGKAYLGCVLNMVFRLLGGVDV